MLVKQCFIHIIYVFSTSKKLKFEDDIVSRPSEAYLKGVKATLSAHVGAILSLHLSHGLDRGDHDLNLHFSGHNCY